MGTTVGVLCPNVPAFATVFHGILRAGATATTINSLYTADEIANQLTDAGATWLVTVSPLLPGAQAAAEKLGFDADHVIVLDGAEGHPSSRRFSVRGARHRTCRSTRRRIWPSSPIPRERQDAPRA